MIIRDFDARTVVLRKEDPTWKFALGASPVTAGVLLTLQTQDGVVGYGYASATAHMGSIPSTLLAELEHLKSKVVGRDAGDIESILDSLDASLRGAGPCRPCRCLRVPARSTGPGRTTGWPRPATRCAGRASRGS